MTEELNLCAYYYSFEPTGAREVDEVLAAVARAGKAFHLTEDWSTEKDFDGKTPIEKIQDAAQRAGAEIDRLRLCLDAAQIELQDRADMATPDHPGYDGTDAAHPAWWRGERHGTAMAASALEKVAREGKLGTFGGEEVERAAEEIDRLRAALTEWKESASMACENPPTGCDCAGCSYAREKNR